MSRDRLEMINNIEEKRNIHNSKVENKEEFSILFLVTYGHNTLKIRDVLKQRKNLLDASFVATTVKPRLTFRRQKNIADIIVQKSLRGPIV